MSKLKDILKQYRTLLRRSDARWRKLLCPYPIDPETQQAEDVRWRIRYNWFIWIVLGSLGILAEVLVFPQIDKMLMIPLLLFAFLVAFCAIMQNSRIKKSPAGRKEKANRPLTRDFAFGDIPARLRRALQRAETKKVRALALTFFIPSLCGE